jgi:TrmH family RNA methyltransferase
VPASISSRHNPRFRAALALREAHERRERGRLLVDGVREIGRALDAGVRLAEAWVVPDDLHDAAAQALLPSLARSGTEMIETTAELLGRLAYGERQDGIVAVAEAPSTDLGRLALPALPLVAVAEGVEKPGNLGALLRAADGAGVDAVIVVDPISDVWNPNAVRASVGTIFSLPMAICGASDALGLLRDRGIAIVAARVDGATDYDAVDLTGPVAIVIGAETTGLSEAWSGPGVTAVRIPMLGVADSLNVSVSAAVLLYEARRQRRAAAARPAERSPGA